VVGCLRVLHALFVMVGPEKVVLDLSGVHEADHEAVRLLAQLPPGRCRLVACPKWLALRIRTEGAGAHRLAIG
jgi:hypothetical protein